MKSVLLILVFSVILLSPSLSNYSASSFYFGPVDDWSLTDNDSYYNSEEVWERLDEMPCLVRKKHDRAVEGYISGYVVRHRDRAERILGRTIQYFPIFEEYLREHDMPDELKYLAVVESALNPKAVSRVGATGLWQFMEATGRAYGLEINEYVDERSDPVKSTLAAIEYLKKQYDRFGSWDLALAAYNSGGGRVNRAVRRARSKNFWKVRRYLPRETRNYVPAFIGATYLCLYYEEHGMMPEVPQLDQLLTQRIEVTEYLPFHRIAQVTGLPLSLIEQLNPAYKKGYLPYSKDGNYLELPKRVMPAMIDYIELKKNGDLPKGVRWEKVFTNPPANHDPDEPYFVSTYLVQQGDSLASLSELFGCSAHALLAWNELNREDPLEVGKELMLYHPVKLLRFELRVDQPLDLLPAVADHIKASPPDADPAVIPLPIESNGRYDIYRTRGGESMRYLSLSYKISLANLIELNPKYHPDQILRAGIKLKVIERR